MDEQTSLKEVIDNLYRVFEGYPIKKKIEADPCFVTEEEQKQLRSAPLRELMDLEKYSYKAISSWGDLDDFKHFLPRIFEILLIKEQFDFIEIIFERLKPVDSNADLNNWPIAEQEAIHNYFFIGWKHLLNQYESKYMPDSWLCVVGMVGIDLQPYLEEWVNARSITGYAFLADFAEGEAPYYFKKKKLSNGFWDSAAKAHEQIINWLKNPDTKNQLESIFFRHSSDKYAGALSDAVQALEFWL